MLPQLKGALLVDRVEEKGDHVLVYLEEVRHTHGEERRTPAGTALVTLLLVLQLPKDIPINHRLELRQEFLVENLKAAVVEIYDYYQPSKPGSSHSTTAVAALSRPAVS